jgi:ectoine hydroxylase-related dioxygenase (phytanoyl-CoA dioxygenase family)
MADMDTMTRLTKQQVKFFETFGYVTLPGLFRDEIGEIDDAFENVFAHEGHPRMETYVELHGEERRVIIPQFVTKHPTLNRLRDDPRVVGIVTSLLGDDHEYAESDGNRFDCESLWHSDTYGAPMGIRHVKVSFYLDTLRADSGAIRVIPGSQHFQESYATALRGVFREPSQIEEKFGVAARDIPSVALETEPGDVVVWDFRSIHASYNGRVGRRLFSINFREKPTDQTA